jgi:hypothetical protein
MTDRRRWGLFDSPWPVEPPEVPRAILCASYLDWRWERPVAASHCTAIFTTWPIIDIDAPGFGKRA